MNDKINNFNREKIFYPYILNYIATLHGLIDLSSRAISQILEKIPKDCDRRKNILQDLPSELRNEFLKHDGIRPLIGNLSLKSIFQKNCIDIDIKEISTEFINNPEYIFNHQLKASGNLILMCYEISKQYDDKSDIWNFFYHCRNAAAHGGYFNITNMKRFPAKWEDIEISTNLNKTNLFLDSKKCGLISLGDPIRLLWEIEQKYL